MYSSLLFIHSWTRWVVLIVGVVLTGYFFIGWVQKKSWSNYQDSLTWTFSQILSYQILFGFCLYIGGSPFTKVLISNPSVALKQYYLVFWTVQHPLSMLFAFVTFQLGKGIASRQTVVIKKYKVLSLSFLLTMLTILSAIPWPFLNFGRSWFRWDL